MIPMDQKAVIDAIPKHLDAMEKIVAWIILFAIAVAWAGIQRKRRLELLGVEFERTTGFYVSSVAYLMANTMILIYFLRIGDVVRLLEKDKIEEGVSKLATHSWLLNPFAFFGNGFVSEAHAAEGYGLLIAAWWLCHTSLFMLIEDKRLRVAQTLLYFFLAVGIASMFAIYRVYGIVLSQLSAYNKDALYESIAGTATERFIGVFIGIIVGVLIFSAANYTQHRFPRLEEVARGQAEQGRS